MDISKIKKYLFNLCGATLISLFIYFVGLFVFIYKMTNQLFSNQTVGDIAVFILAFIIILILFKVYNDGIYGNSYKKVYFKNFLEYDKKNMLMLFFLLIISIIFAKSMLLIIGSLTAGNDYTYNTYSTIGLIGVFTYAPIIEELIFRGLFYNMAYEWLDMKNNVVKYITVIVNIIMFLSIHYVNYNFSNFNLISSVLVSFIPRLLITISLSYIYLKTKDIKYNIILHMSYNFLSIIISYFI